VLYPSSFYPSLSLLLLGAARCLCRASLVSFGSQTTRLEELNQRRYSSSRTCTHARRWLAVSLLCCSRGARGLANRPIAPSPSRRLTIACEEGCMCRATLQPIGEDIGASLAPFECRIARRQQQQDDDDKSRCNLTPLPRSPYTPTYVVDRSCLVPRFWRDGACYCCFTAHERDARVLTVLGTS